MRKEKKAIFSVALLLGLAVGPQVSFAAPPSLFVRQPTDETKPLKPSEMLCELRDFRLCLKQLKQQSVNLFHEATRTVVTEAEPPQETTPSTLSPNMLDEKKDYMSPRKEWLVFYVNTLEPITQLLCEDIKDVDTTGRGYPKQIELRTNPLWTTWKLNVEKINRSLDAIQQAIAGDPGSNLVIAKEAIAIYDCAEELERIRYKAALIFREELKKMSTANK